MALEGQPNLIKEVANAGEKGPEVLRNIGFVPVKNKKKEVVGYRSGSFGRKSVELAGEGPFAPIEEGRTYTVRIVEDTDPKDPLSGKYLVKIICEDGDIEHKEALLAKSGRLRGSDSFQAMMDIVNGDVDLSREYRMVTERTEEFKDLQVADGERHRAFTAVFSGLMMSPRSRDLLELTIDRTVADDSSLLKNEIRKGNNFVPELVIGSGVHGAIWSVTRQMYLPESPSLTVEQSNIVGGQFAEYGRALFRKNDRQRPELRDKKHLPGSEQSLTTFTDFATVQPSDLGGEAYPHQSTTADSSRINFFLTGRAILGEEIQRISLNPDEFGETKGKYVVEVCDMATGRVDEIYTDRVVFTTGLGKEDPKLNKIDVETQNILKEEEQKFESGQDAKVMSFGQFCRRAGDRSNPFPMEGIKRLVLSGDGDSAVVAAGIALGYESQMGKTTTQLDSVEEIIWIGPKWLTKEEFIECARARYHWVGLDFPRESFANYYHRIKPIGNARVDRLKRDGESIKVICQNGQEYTGDHYVYAHGFRDETDSIIAPLYNEVFTRYADIGRSIDNGAVFNYPNGQIYYKSGPIRKLEVIGNPKQEKLKFRTISKKGETVDYEVDSTDKIPKKLLDSDNISRIEVGYDDSPATNFVFDEDSRENENPVASQVRDRNSGRTYDVYKVGPSAKLPLTRNERLNAPVLESIPENTAAIFRYAEYTAAFARSCAREDAKKAKKASGLMATKSKAGPKKLKKISPRETTVDSFNVSVAEPNHRNRIPYDLNTLDGIKLVVGENLREYSFPEAIENISLSVKRKTAGQADGEGQIEYVVETKPKLPLGYTEIFSELFNDSLYGQFINKTTSLRGKKNPNAVVMNIPLNKGKVIPSGITYVIPRN